MMLGCGLERGCGTQPWCLMLALMRGDWYVTLRLYDGNQLMRGVGVVA